MWSGYHHHWCCQCFAVISLQLKEAIEVELRQSGLQVTPFTMTKVIQLYETKNSRHASMLVGKTGSGKSVTWRTLQNALTALHHRGEPGFQPVQVSVDGKQYTGFFCGSRCCLDSKKCSGVSLSFSDVFHFFLFYYNAPFVIFFSSSLWFLGPCGTSGLSSEPQGNESGRAVWRKWLLHRWMDWRSVVLPHEISLRRCWH